MTYKKRRRTAMMPFDMGFFVNGNYELCHATGYQVFDGQVWWNEYINSMGEYEYGN